MSIKLILDSLTPEQRRRLFHAFDNGFGQLITLDENKFIGVNITDTMNLKIEETINGWSYGSRISTEE